MRYGVKEEVVEKAWMGRGGEDVIGPLESTFSERFAISRIGAPET